MQIRGHTVLYIFCLTTVFGSSRIQGKSDKIVGKEVISIGNSQGKPEEPIKIFIGGEREPKVPPMPPLNFERPYWDGGGSAFPVAMGIYDPNTKSLRFGSLQETAKVYGECKKLDQKSSNLTRNWCLIGLPIFSIAALAQLIAFWAAPAYPLNAVLPTFSGLLLGGVVPAIALALTRDRRAVRKQLKVLNREIKGYRAPALHIVSSDGSHISDDAKREAILHSWAEQQKVFATYLGLMMQQDEPRSLPGCSQGDKRAPLSTRMPSENAMLKTPMMLSIRSLRGMWTNAYSLFEDEYDVVTRQLLGDFGIAIISAMATLGPIEGALSQMGGGAFV